MNMCYYRLLLTWHFLQEIYIIAFLMFKSAWFYVWTISNTPNIFRNAFWGLVSQSILGGEFRYQGSAFFLTYLVLGDDAKSGEGSTATSDLYLDFGIPGVIFGFLIFGLIIRRLDNSLLFSFENNFFIWIAALCYLSSAVYIARSAILFQIQQIIPIYIVILFFVNFFKTSKNWVIKFCFWLTDSNPEV